MKLKEISMPFFNETLVKVVLQISIVVSAVQERLLVATHPSVFRLLGLANVPTIGDCVANFVDCWRV